MDTLGAEMNLVQDALRQMTEDLRKLGTPMPMYEFVLEHGEGFETARPAEKLGTPKECFANAARRIIRNGEELIYAEGFVVHEEFAFPLLHAWLVDKNRTVVETTLGSDLTKMHYFGVRYKYGFVLAQMLKYEVFGILGGHPRQVMELITETEMKDWKYD